MHVLYNLLLFVHFLVGISVIAVITMQESKNEGLTGQIGTTVQSSFKGKAGREERLNDTTRKLAITFFVLSALVAFGAGRW
ncbi:MAG: preprotein translocase subunit SecG [Chloroherpetonaceae bacterium]|nr:preprotein translocase subunit SecG [Chthonomonadaceae bacterium]MDW8209319.1 preprotein translocase subunit SecG [Chloroherpetonaceae bacterium]